MYKERLFFLSNRLGALLGALEVVVEARWESVCSRELSPAQLQRYRALFDKVQDATILSTAARTTLEIALTEWVGQTSVARELVAAIARDLEWLCDNPTALAEVAKIQRRLRGEL